MRNIDWRAAARREARPLSEAEQAARAKRREQAQAAQQRREAETAAHEARRLRTAGGLWRVGVAIGGTASETYLLARGIPIPAGGWPECLRHVDGLAYELDDRLTFPALLCRVEGVDGRGKSIWRVYLSTDGRDKAPVEKPKVGLAPARGGAVKLGGAAERVNLCEGIETALAIWTLTEYRRPVWACLSTSGLIGIELPDEVKVVTIWPDGDHPIKRKGGGYVPAEPVGMKAARALTDRLKANGIKVTINPVPKAATDYLDALNAMRGAA
ncbi:MAG: toprim domain-containing protein [Pseudorhodoplanes sp.]|uniref:DUF7146 domain-containing protein n=1 Tax=Pseudorhodoplanes sp. TaxID=1934341 RepID=UPI003D0BDEBE